MRRLRLFSSCGDAKSGTTTTANSRGAIWIMQSPLFDRRHADAEQVETVGRAGDTTGGAEGGVALQVAHIEEVTELQRIGAGMECDGQRCGIDGRLRALVELRVRHL